MTRFRASLYSVIALALLAFSPVLGEDAECSATSSDSDSEGVLLLQTQKRGVPSLSDALTLLDDQSTKEDAHIVCHTQSCAEVQASLAVIKSKQQVAKQKLDECSKARKQLQSDLAAAGKKRAEAEKGLAKCAAERAKLAAELRQCAEVDRPNAERALAECSRDRAKLEAELRQCAVVDRPAAEKGLAQCAKDRAKLEALLKALASGKKGAASARRRRRRRSKKRFSLLEEDSAESELSGAGTAEVDTAIHSEEEDLETEEESMTEEEAEAMAELNRLDGLAANLLTQLADADSRQSKVEKGLESVEAKEAASQILMKKAEAKFSVISAGMDRVGNDLSAAEKEVTIAVEEAEKAEQDLAGQQSDETAALMQLASLIQEEHQVLHDHLHKQHAENEARLRNHDVALSEVAAKVNGEGCDEARAQIVSAQGKLDLTAGALKACLTAKKEIQVKIDNVVTLGEAAAAGLQKCLDTKAELKVRIKQCHDRRDLAREKLKECLDRKKVLKEQIKKCHEKRDDARAKLKACLERKAELKGKIDALRKRSSLMQDASGSEEDLEHLHKLHADSESELNSLLDTLGEQNEEFSNLVKDLQINSDQETQEVDEMSSVTTESNSAFEDIAVAEKDEAESEALTTSFAAQIQDAVAHFKRVRPSLAGALKAIEAAGAQVDKAEKAVSLVMQENQ